MRVQSVIFPGIFFGCLAIIFLTGMVANPHIALAKNITTGVTGVIVDLVEGAAGQEADSAAVNTVNANPDSLTNFRKAAPSSGDCSLSSNYPQAIRQWCAYIEKYAGENGIAPGLVAAVMLQESGGNPSAYSGSGAVGLMQIMASDGTAATFMCGGGPCFSDRPSMRELYDPEFNISYGARMLAELVNRNGGSVREALRAYGPMDRGYSYADMVLSIYNGY